MDKTSERVGGWRRRAILAAIVVGVGVAAWSASMQDWTSTSPTLSAKEHADAQATVASLQSVDAVTRYDCAAHEAYIRPDAWLTLDAAAKRGVTLALAVTCAKVGQSSPAHMTILDNQSGKRLAYVGAFGYSVE